MIVPITKWLQLASSEIAPGDGSASHFYAHPDTGPVINRRYNPAGDQSLTALMVRGEDEYLVMNTDFLASIHRLFVERQRSGFRCRRGFYDKWHLIPVRWKSRNASMHSMLTGNERDLQDIADGRSAD